MLLRLEGAFSMKRCACTKQANDAERHLCKPMKPESSRTYPHCTIAQSRRKPKQGYLVSYSLLRKSVISGVVQSTAPMNLRRITPLRSMM